MLDDLFNLVTALLGEETGPQRGAGQRLPDGARRQEPYRQKTPPAGRSQPDRRSKACPAAEQPPKLAARRNRRGGEDPWDWKEEKPPWEF